jgi:wyosine [tRNA(Phe)-imidazoG37] synthetase (radical SAM superfamily)
MSLENPRSTTLKKKKPRCVCKNNVIGLILRSRAVTNEVKKVCPNARFLLIGADQMNDPVMTKNCISPWVMLEIFATGKLKPCDGPLTGDYGNADNFIDDPSALRDVLNSKAHRELRMNLLTGNIPDACITCRNVPDELVPAASIEAQVRQIFENERTGRLTLEDLAGRCKILTCNAGVTDKCNLSCIYCFIHSNDAEKDGSRQHYCAIDYDKFLGIIEILIREGLTRLHFCGVGEFTSYPRWKELCKKLFNTYPQLKISLVSNFSRKFTEDDYDVLKRFFQISISCDTLDPELYAWLRRGARIETVLENIEKLRGRYVGTETCYPKIIFNITESDVIVDTLEDLARYAYLNDIHINVSNLILAEGTFARQNKSITKIIDMPQEKLFKVWEMFLDLTDRFTAALRPVPTFGLVYETLGNKVEALTHNRFVPAEGEIFYQAFADAHPKNPHAYLKKFFLDFDMCIKGILIKLDNGKLEFTLPFPEAKLRYRIARVNKDAKRIYVGNEMDSIVKSPILIETAPGKEYDHILFEVLSYESC